MTNLDFLNAGQIFPPLSEAKRIGKCADYGFMYDGNVFAAEERHFKETQKNLNRVADLLGRADGYTAVVYNYFKLLSKKTADCICGDFPDIKATNTNETVGQKEQVVLDAVRADTVFDIKHYDAWLDVSKYGEAYFRVYTLGNKNTFTLLSPAAVIRVTDGEDGYEVKNFVVARFDDNCEGLKVEIHFKGYYIARTYRIERCAAEELFINQIRYEIAAVDNPNPELYTLVRDRYTDEIFRCPFFRLKEQTVADEKVETQLDDFAIVPITGIADAARSGGVSDYDDVAPLISQMQSTMNQMQLVFDKYTIPTIGVSADALTQCEENGANIFETGKAISISESGVMPQFIEPDFSRLEIYFRQLEFSLARIKELSEMGAAFDPDGSAANHGVENLKRKAARLTARNTANIKKLLHLISMNGYERAVPVEDISVIWNGGYSSREAQN